MPKYATIIFLNDYEDSNVTNFFLDEIDEDQLIEYLSAWDYGEYHDVYEGEGDPWGTADDTYFSPHNEYVLAYNRGLGYAALQIAVDD